MCQPQKCCRNQDDPANPPRDCSPEDQMKCRGQDTPGQPPDCSPEKIRECHGEVDEHPCT